MRADSVGIASRAGSGCASRGAARARQRDRLARHLGIRPAHERALQAVGRREPPALQELRLDRGTGALRLENSILYGAEDLNSSGTPEIDTTNLIGFDPSFENPAAGDYRLKPISTAIGLGNADHASVGRYDAGHGRRVVGIETDAGAYEAGELFSDDFESGFASAWSEVRP